MLFVGRRNLSVDWVEMVGVVGWRQERLTVKGLLVGPCFVGSYVCGVEDDDRAFCRLVIMDRLMWLAPFALCFSSFLRAILEEEFCTVQYSSSTVQQSKLQSNRTVRHTTPLYCTVL
jgi:hypothetical protein